MRSGFHRLSMCVGHHPVAFAPQVLAPCRGVGRSSLQMVWLWWDAVSLTGLDASDLSVIAGLGTSAWRESAELDASSGMPTLKKLVDSSVLGILGRLGCHIYLCIRNEYEAHTM